MTALASNLEELTPQTFLTKFCDYFELDGGELDCTILRTGVMVILKQEDGKEYSMSMTNEQYIELHNSIVNGATLLETKILLASWGLLEI